MKNISCTATDIKWVVIHITQLPRKGDKTGKMGDRCLKIFFDDYERNQPEITSRISDVISDAVMCVTHYRVWL